MISETNAVVHIADKIPTLSVLMVGSDQRQSQDPLNL